MRLGVMMPGVFPNGPNVNVTYLDAIEDIVDRLHANDIETIIDLHQDVLAPKVCGEGTPDWMLNVSELNAKTFPKPMSSTPIDMDPETGRPKSCSPVGALKFLGWSEWYTTDACGKAFQELYDGSGAMADAFARYWKVVATRFKGHPGVMAYELLNEPWVGDHVGNPLLLLKGGRAEEEVAKYMQRMHDVVRSVDPDTLIMYAPAEVNNRIMRRVGYEKGFLPEAAMAYHVYCVVGTDGDGPTSWFEKQLCHTNDHFSLNQRAKDIARLQTAGFVTEFGAVNPSPTGLAEVQFVLEHFESMTPPTSWAFWDFHEITGHSNKTQVAAYIRLLARPYPTALAGELVSLNFDSQSSAFRMQYKSSASGSTELFLPKQLRYPSGYSVKVSPKGAVDIFETDSGLKMTANSSQDITVEVTASSLQLV